MKTSEIINIVVGHIAIAIIGYNSYNIVHGGRVLLLLVPVLYILYRLITDVIEVEKLPKYKGQLMVDRDNQNIEVDNKQFAKMSRKDVASQPDRVQVRSKKYKEAKSLRDLLK